MLEHHYLTTLFEPKSVAVIGASDRENSVGNVLFKNILDSGYKGRLYPINTAARHHPGRAGLQVDRRDQRPRRNGGHRHPTADGAENHRAMRPQRRQERDRHHLRLCRGGHSGAALERKMMEIARSYGVRLLGPNCLGIIRPRPWPQCHLCPRARQHVGNLALVSQSGAICSAVLDWATSNRIGFSSVISLGGTADVDFGEILDYLIYDNRTHYILLYVEGIRDARRFMSALRSAARIKPIVLLKAGRHAGGLAAVETHSGMAAGSDIVFDAAVRRAGVVRVKNIGQLFYAAKALASKFRPQGKRLAIITNGGGPGAMAADRAGDLEIPLAALSPSTMQKLNAKPCRRPGRRATRWTSRAMRRRSVTTTPLLPWPRTDAVDGVLVMLSPQAMTQPMEVAKAVIEVDLLTAKPILTCWMGEEQVA
jgi:acetyltransferase